MASLETNVSVTPEMENTLENSITIQTLILEMKELKRAKERTEVKLAMLEANIMKEPMKCKRACAKLGKLSQHSLIESYAKEFQNSCAKVVTSRMSVGDKIHCFIDGL